MKTQGAVSQRAGYQGEGAAEQACHRACVCGTLSEKDLMNKEFELRKSDKLTLTPDEVLSLFPLAENKYRVTLLGAQRDTVLRPASLSHACMCVVLAQKKKQKKKTVDRSFCILQVSDV